MGKNLLDGITIYDFSDAPQHWRDIANQGGDEDFIIFEASERPPNLISGEDLAFKFMVCDVNGPFLVEGGRIWVTTHA